MVISPHILKLLLVPTNLASIVIAGGNDRMAAHSSGENGVLIEHSHSPGVGALKEFLSGVKGGNYVRSRKT